MVVTASESSDTTWEAPESLERAEIQLEETTNDIQRIQAQLSDRDKTDASGRRVSVIEFHQWRKKATYALAARLREQRRLKRWIQEHRRIAHEAQTRTDRPRNVVELVAALARAMKDGHRLVRDGAARAGTRRAGRAMGSHDGRRDPTAS